MDRIGVTPIIAHYRPDRNTYTERRIISAEAVCVSRASGRKARNPKCAQPGIGVSIS